MKTAALVAAVLLCLLSGILGCGFFDSTTELPKVVGLLSFGCAAGFLSFLLPPP